MPKPTFDGYVDKDFSALKHIQDKITLDGKTFKLLQEESKKFIEENQDRCKTTPRLWNKPVWKEITGDFIEKNDLGNKYWNSGRNNFSEEDHLLWPDDKDHISFLIFCCLKLTIKNNANNKRKSDAVEDESETATPKSKKTKKSQDETEDGTETPQTGKNVVKDLELEQDGTETPQTGKKAKKSQKGKQDGNETPQTGKKAKKSPEAEQDNAEAPEAVVNADQVQNGVDDSTEVPQTGKVAAGDKGEEHDGTETSQTGKDAEVIAEAGDAPVSEKDKDGDTIVVSTKKPSVAKKKPGRPSKSTPFKVPKMTKKMKENQEKEDDLKKRTEEYAKKQAATSLEDLDDEDLQDELGEPASSTKGVSSEKPKTGTKTNGNVVAAVEVGDEEALANIASAANSQDQAQTAEPLPQLIVPVPSSDPAMSAHDPSTPTPAPKVKPDALGSSVLSIEGVDEDAKETLDPLAPEALSLYGSLATPQTSAGKFQYFNHAYTPPGSNRVGSVYTDLDAPVIEITFVITSKGHEETPIRVKCLSNTTFQHLFAEAQMTSAGPARFGIASTTCANLKIPGGAEVSIKFPDPELKKKWTGAMTMTVASVGDGNLHEGEEVMLYLV